MAKETASNLPKTQVVKLDNFSIVDKSELTVLATKYKNLVVTKETFEESKKARLELRNKRYEIQNIHKKNVSLLNGAKKVMGANAEELIGLILPVEETIDSRIKEIEAQKAEEKRKKEEEKQRIQAERMEKINKLQTEFMNAIAGASTLERMDILKSNLESFEVTEEEFGDLTLSCQQTIANIELSINQGIICIEKQLEAEKAAKLDAAKSEYFVKTGEVWSGEDDIKLIGQAVADFVLSSEKSKAIKEYLQLGGEGILDETMTLDSIIGHLSTLKAEVAELAKQKREDDKKAKEAKEKLRAYRLDELTKAGISDLGWATKIQANDYPDKMIEELTEEQFNLFKENLVAIKAELDRKRIDPEARVEKTMKVEEVATEAIEKVVKSCVADEKANLLQYITEFEYREKIGYTTKTVIKLHDSFQNEFDALIEKHSNKLK